MCAREEHQRRGGACEGRARGVRGACERLRPALAASPPKTGMSCGGGFGERVSFLVGVSSGCFAATIWLSADHSGTHVRTQAPPPVRAMCSSVWHSTHGERGCDTLAAALTAIGRCKVAAAILLVDQRPIGMPARHRAARAPWFARRAQRAQAQQPVRRRSLRVLAAAQVGVDGRRRIAIPLLHARNRHRVGRLLRSQGRHTAASRHGAAAATRAAAAVRCRPRVLCDLREIPAASRVGREQALEDVLRLLRQKGRRHVLACARTRAARGAGHRHVRVHRGVCLPLLLRRPPRARACTHTHAPAMIFL